MLEHQAVSTKERKISYLRKNYGAVSVEKWSTEFGIQEIDESQIATV